MDTMLKSVLLTLSAIPVIIAAFSTSTHYSLNSYAVGPGGSSNSSSTTYSLQGSVGEQANGVSSDASSNKGGSGSIQTEQINVPPAPTLSNGSGTYSNRLGCIINNSADPSDATYAIQISASPYTTDYYVQAAGTLGSSPVYQTYTAWGGASGLTITGLLPSTTYEVNVAALEGKFTNTEFGPVATASTVSNSVTFTVSPNTINVGSLLAGSVETSPNISLSYTTNSANGGGIYVSGANNPAGLYSAHQGFTIPAYTGNLTSQSQGFGLQDTNVTQTSGGPFAAVSPFNGTGNSVGAESTEVQEILSSGASISNGTAYVNLQAKASSITPPSTDYQEILTFIAAASF
jgi:hypothetical protein